MGVAQRIATWGSLVKFSHSLFALPFAMMMVVFVARSRAVTGAQIVALLVCIVAARTAAMGFNRLVDAKIDALNPRTKSREIPSGVVPRSEGVLVTGLSAGVFILGSAALGPHCLVLAPPVLVILLGYSYVKRWSSMCHLILGIALALAPGGVWFALTAEWSWTPVWLMAGVALWVAGFDILYSCQDAGFDREHGLFSVPSRVGVSGALKISGLCHLGSVFFLVVTGERFDLGAIYYVGLSLFAALLASQHLAIQRRGVGCIDQVFFTRNGAASVLLFIFVLIDASFRG